MWKYLIILELSFSLFQIYNGSLAEPYVNPRATVHLTTGSAVSTVAFGRVIYLLTDGDCKDAIWLLIDLKVLLDTLILMCILFLCSIIQLLI